MRPTVVAVVGPTGSGKTDLACALAERARAEIISADSMQVYRGMDIGTAKPSPEIRARIRHHLIDAVDPDAPMSAGRYMELARAAAHAIHARGRRVVLCGGTGLYARAFACGLVPDLPAVAEMRARLHERSTEALRAELLAIDPESARAIPARDRVRLERALEAHAHAGRAVSSLREAHGFRDRPFALCWIGVAREPAELSARIERRVDAMLAEGWLDEVIALRARYPPHLRALQAIGYRELGAHLDGAYSLAEARRQIIVATRRYAKRQRTWFRAEAGLVWISADAPAAIVEAGLAAFDRGSA